MGPAAFPAEAFADVVNVGRHHEGSGSNRFRVGGLRRWSLGFGFWELEFGVSDYVPFLLHEIMLMSQKAEKWSVVDAGKIGGRQDDFVGDRARAMKVQKIF